MEYSSNAKGNLGVTLGAIGTGLSLMDSGIGLLGRSGTSAASSNFVSKEELKMSQELASKDSQIAILTADKASESKMIEVYKQSHSEVAALRDQVNSDIKELQNEINQNRRDQDLWNAAQNVANAQMSAAITANNTSIAGLQNIIGQITQVRVPNTAVCPGWGNVTITPAAAG